MAASSMCMSTSTVFGSTSGGLVRRMASRSMTKRMFYTTSPTTSTLCSRTRHRTLGRHLSTSPSTSTSSSRTSRLALLGLSLGVGLGGSIYLLHSPVRLDASLSTPLAKRDETADSPHKKQQPLSSLFRAYIVYSLCSIPALVDASPAVLKYTFSIPGVRWVSENVVRGTFFAQFVGGDTAEEALPIVAALRREGKGTLFAYSVEVDEDEASGSGSGSQVASNSSNGSKDNTLPIHKRIVEEMVHSIDVAADFEDGQGQGQNATKGRRTWVAVKLTALLPDAHALHRLSAHLVRTRPPLPAGELVPFPGAPRDADLDVLKAAVAGPVESTLGIDALPHDSPLTPQDLHELKELRDDLFRICSRAEERGVRIIIDAEYSWYQPAIDAYTLALMRRFNRLPSSSSLSSKLSIGKLIRCLKGDNDNKIDVVEHGGRVQPLVYATYQAYLRRTPAHLAHDIAAARKGGFALGVKLVRGAYHPHEIASHPSSPPALLADSMTLATATSPEVSTPSSTTNSASASESKKSTSTSGNRATLSISPEPVPPVWLAKEESDACYNACVALLVGAVAQDLRAKRGPSVGVLFGTHNWHSCDVVLDELVRAGLASRENVAGAGLKGGKERGTSVVSIPDEVCERVTMGQLYGMSDALTDSIVERTRTSMPFVIKYVPYGALVEVMPYLSRRAIENKTILGGRGGGAADERRRAGNAILERLFGVFGFRAS